jgi:ATP-dependent DNA ligase
MPHEVTHLPRVSPMIPIEQPQPFNDPAWSFEPKYDGFRGLLYIDGDEATFYSKRGLLLRRFQESAWNGIDYRARPLLKRREQLERVVGTTTPMLSHPHMLADRGADLFRAIVQLDLEGIVAKRPTDPYGPRRAGSRSRTGAIPRRPSNASSGSTGSDERADPLGHC